MQEVGDERTVHIRSENPGREDRDGRARFLDPQQRGRPTSSDGPKARTASQGAVHRAVGPTTPVPRLRRRPHSPRVGSRGHRRRGTGHRAQGGSGCVQGGFQVVPSGRRELHQRQRDAQACGQTQG